MTDDKLIEYVKAFRDGLGIKKSSGWCFMTCSPLATLLSCEGVFCKMVHANYGIMEHYWLELQDGRVLDPTCDQFGFGLPKVYLGKPLPGIHAPHAPVRIQSWTKIRSDNITPVDVPDWFVRGLTDVSRQIDKMKRGEKTP